MWRRLVVFKVLLLVALTLTACSSGAYYKNKEGNDLFGQGKLDEAMEMYRSAQVAQPDLPQLQYNAGNVLHEDEQYSEAVTQTLKALNGADTELQAWTHYNVGNSHVRQEDYAGAIEDYKAALRLDPNDQDAKLNLEIALHRLQEQQNEDHQNSQQQDQQQQNKQQSGQRTATPTPQTEQESQEGANTPTPTAQAEGQPEEDQNTSTPTPQPEGQSQPEQDTSTPTPQAAADSSTDNPEGMTEEQALQLLRAIGKDDKTLQEYLLKQSPTRTVERDW